MPLYDGTFFGYELSQGNILFAVLVLAVSYIFLKIAQFNTSPISRIKLVPGWPIVNQMPALLFSEDFAGLHLKFIKSAEEEGIYRYRGLLGVQMIGICKPEFVKHLLVTNSKNYKKPGPLVQRMKTAEGGLFLAYGSEHAWQRKLMNPMFSHGSVKCYIESFESQCANLVKVWSENCRSVSDGSASIIVGKDLTHLTLDIIGKTAFGHDFNSVLTGGTKISKTFSDILEGNLDAGAIILKELVPLYRYLPTSGNRKVAEALAITSALIDEVVQKRREEVEEGNTAKRQQDLLSVMIKACDEDSGKKMTDNLLIRNIWTFMIAGHETTSVGLTWTLYHLARHPDIQEKARKEALEVLQEQRCLVPDDIDKLVYITAVIKESLRRNPPAAIFVRESIKGDTFGDYYIPGGSILSVPIGAIHHWDKYWAEPFKFVPERFLDSDETWSSGIAGQTYLPFSHGPRNCIGSKFAMMEMKVVIARLLTNFRFSMDPNHPKVNTKLLLTLKPVPSPALQVSLLEK